jgi:hypothetical protein
MARSGYRAVYPAFELREQLQHLVVRERQKLRHDRAGDSLRRIEPEVGVEQSGPGDPLAGTAKTVSSRRKPVRNIGALPKHLPRCEVVIEPESKTCPCCQGTLHPIGEDVTEQLDVIPAILQVRRIRRPR